MDKKYILQKKEKKRKNSPALVPGDDYYKRTHVESRKITKYSKIENTPGMPPEVNISSMRRRPKYSK